MKPGKSSIRFPRPGSSLRPLLLMGMIALGAMPAAMAEPQPGVARPEVQDLGNQRYRIGAIELDKGEQRFRVPGVVLAVDGPLEYIAVTKGGTKSYESLLELNVNAFEFNLACILIGLDSSHAKLSQFHFDPEPVQGDPVKIGVSWSVDGNKIETGAEGMLLAKGEPVNAGVWVYTGSSFTPDDRYLAQLDGTLIGFVHDPASIIEHGTGLGLGMYGSLQVNQALLPPSGTPVTVTIERVSPPSP